MTDDFGTRLQHIVEKIDPPHRTETQLGVDKILQIGVNSYEDLLAILRDGSQDSDLHQTVCWVLCRLKDPSASSALLAALTDQDLTLRRAAAQALGDLRIEEAIHPLSVALLEDEATEVRAFAAYSLGYLSSQDTVEPLLIALKNQNEDPGVRGHAAEGLAHKENAQIVPALIGALRDNSAEVRFWAAFALGQRGDPRALPELEQLVATDKAVVPGWWAVSKEAADAIEIIQSSQSKMRRSDLPS
jgi:HEAT repeat protein